MSYSIYNPTNISVGYTSTPASTSATNLTWGGVATGTGLPTWSSSPVTITQKATIDLKGEDADVIINGESLKDSIREIKDALRIPSKLTRDPVLEKEWEELQAAGEHYQKLLKEYKEKQKVWDTLKSQD